MTEIVHPTMHYIRSKSGFHQFFRVVTPPSELAFVPLSGVLINSIKEDEKRGQINAKISTAEKINRLSTSIW